MKIGDHVYGVHDGVFHGILTSIEGNDIIRVDYHNGGWFREYRPYGFAGYYLFLDPFEAFVRQTRREARVEENK